MTRTAAILLATAFALLAFASPGAHAATADNPAATAATTRDAGARQKPRTPGQRRQCRRGATRKTSGTRRGGASKAKAKTCAKTKTEKKKTKPKAKPKPKPSSPGTTSPSGETGTTTPTQDGGTTGSTPSGGSTTPTGDGGSTTPELNAVGVKAYDRSGTFVFETTRSTVRTGELTVSFHNYDLDDHNLWFEGTSPLVSPVMLSDAIPLHGDVTSTVTVAAGAYRFFCTVPGHSTMTKALTVQ